MTGSAFTRWALYFKAGGCNRGGSLREGSGRPILLDGRLADFSFSLVFLGFSWLFPGDGKRFDALDVAC